MVVNGWVIGSLVLVVVIIGTALVRQRSAPPLQTTEDLALQVQALQREVGELREQTARQKATIDTLQNLLVNRQAEVDRLNARMWQLEHSPGVATTAPAAQARPAHPPTLLAVVGEDPALKIDLAALREVERESTLRVSRVYPVTKAKLKATLDRFRVNGRPVEYVHMAVHAGPQGLAFQGETVDAQWLSENLKSVKVLLINGCQSDEVGDWIGVVPTVVTMREAITHEDAAQFAKLFWSAIAAGTLPEDAYYAARERSPQGVSEFVELN